MRIGSCHLEKRLQERVLPIGSEGRGTPYCTELTSPVFAGGSYSTVSTDSGMIFTELRCSRVAEAAVAHVSSDDSFCKFTFQLQPGRSLVQLGESTAWIQYEPGTSHFLSPLVQEGRLWVEPGQALHLDTLFVPIEVIAILLEDEQRSLPVHLQRLLARPHAGPSLFCASMSPRVWAVLQELQASPFHGQMQRVYMNAKLTELAVLRLGEELEPHPAREHAGLQVKLSARDCKKVEEAADILSARLQHPPTLHELGVLVGLNLNKLKQGFHRLYGTSAFCFLHSLRMRQAYELLRDSELSISEIAERIGYTRQSAFSAAFRREYGVAPREIKKSCR